MANLLITGCLSLQGAALPDGRLRVLSQEVAEVDGKLSLDIMFGLEGVSIGSCQAIVVSPVVEGPGWRRSLGTDPGRGRGAGSARRRPSPGMVWIDARIASPALA